MVLEAGLEKKHDAFVWEVEIVTTENKVMEVHMDAGTGTVIDVEEEKPVDDMRRERKQVRKREHRP